MTGEIVHGLIGAGFPIVFVILPSLLYGLAGRRERARELERETGLARSLARKQVIR